MKHEVFIRACWVEGWGFDRLSLRVKRRGPNSVSHSGEWLLAHWAAPFKNTSKFIRLFVHAHNSHWMHKSLSLIWLMLPHKTLTEVAKHAQRRQKMQKSNKKERPEKHRISLRPYVETGFGTIHPGTIHSMDNSPHRQLYGVNCLGGELSRHRWNYLFTDFALFKGVVLNRKEKKTSLVYVPL